ncbi:hypothetical protein ACQKEY_19130 [Lysinibacillus fusiformis]|uniref:hypothetical protein n=1 Tax=Lysinibacillus fusiformis TaxID=28031 RepID=UPI000D37ABEF|nr:MULTISPECIES: hypothetical protein [Lysinibacillus]MCG7435670.1 hypothetical protein [Lysinibacillus fusiformis]MED4670505.1 hypothetical protein [Lysinibacillus fusiformis]QAS56739.1 hypothetical protein LSP_10375 [Lysinibacillus sphaericus]RDV32258.1 hypothetical protein C7B90_09770 [Lysinibacillus fusiformis]GED62726.1 hypothetical protein LFU01_11780 [Lysinibacillus fusiformis]
MFELFRKKKMSLNRGLYDVKFILKKYKTEEKMKKLSKEQLEKIISTLEIELHFQNNRRGAILTFIGSILVVMFFMIPIMTNSIGSGYFQNFNGDMYQLESVELELLWNEERQYNDNVMGTFKQYNGSQKEIFALKMGLFIYVGICLVYFSSLFYINRIYKLYNQARYIHSLKII